MSSALDPDLQAAAGDHSKSIYSTFSIITLLQIVAEGDLTRLRRKNVSIFSQTGSSGDHKIDNVNYSQNFL